MKSFPMFIRTTGRRVVIAGGAEQAAQKARLIQKTDAEILLAAPDLDPELAHLVASRRATQEAGPLTAATFAGTAMVFVATGCAGADAALHALAKAAGATVNVVDRPELCDITTPAIVDRDPVVVAIGTEGTAPVLARAIKTRLEESLPLNLGGLAAFAGTLRGAVAQRLPAATRRAFWRWVFREEPARLHARGAEREASRLVKDALAEGRVPEGAGRGMISLVGAGPGARDLLTLRAVERLQEADVIFYDRLAGTEALELARRDAERVCVGKTVGASTWPQEQITALIVAEARRGRRVVRLKSGDPSIFGRATEEIEAARAAGIPVEIVPGVTAAFAAAAAMGESLTRRGETDTLVFTTGACRDGDGDPDWAAHVRPGASFCLYMGVRSAPRIAAALRTAGACPGTRVDICAEVSTARQRLLTCTLSELPSTLAKEGVDGVAILRFAFPKRGQAPVPDLLAAE
ncbi:siroheme synthase CysG [Pseudoroseicyclus aestuarii]|uniref:Uroporphyrin-III C-methyltransferase/precorrin-2 dehydrogenase/sirohydrochlorin ferrochelatase n=1 Tax=Pseudoroseicyclus aestuarii TaxID=1795041 RepID=A0A318SQ82_9RHOB|nr:siroheme synthase CysG [Pseudoroseicyclus aestuarii]PYE84030.1 uroporphyrin-III C-methyltransferase/precorrin-2 dehydrogenase/sirohydrochlorin ferrochelatase [Pseudoroseicyclus aestuarii]